MGIETNAEIQQTYEIIEEIGAGGGGTIYKAYHKRLQKYVVLKKIHSNVKNAINIRMETDILKNLHHYYLPQVFDFLEVDNDIYTVMDFIPGKSFEQLIKEEYKFTKEQILKYTRQLCEAMAYLHGQNPPIIHGDIKPANIMLTPDDNICLIDFNISGFLLEKNMVTIGYSKGYAAPEQYRAVMNLKKSLQEEKTELLDKGNSHESVMIDNSAACIDLRADIYSIGATIYHIATGSRIDELNSNEKFAEENLADYSNGFITIIEKALKLDPNDRFKDAIEMLQAINNIHKYDRQYRTLVIKQEIGVAFILLFIGVSVAVCAMGRQKMKQEKQETYNEMISDLMEMEDVTDEEYEKLFVKACNYMPEKLDAYYQKAIFLTKKGRYEENIKFIQDNLINKADFLGQSFSDDVYYILANCYFELEEYKEAVIYYQAAIDIDNHISQYYGDYAIALVYCNRIDDAEEVLRQGRERGMASDYILLVSAEIESAQGKYDQALQYFIECLDITQNQQMKLRAYVLADKTFRKQEISEEVLLESVELLKRAETDLEFSNQILILERLAQDYIDLAVVTEDSEYDHKAIEVFNRIIQYGWDNYTTHINLAILYEKTGQLSEAEGVLKKLLEEDAENYITYKRLAILEIDIQALKANEDRDYGQFLEYYNETMRLCEQSGEKTSDVEIQWLEQAYAQLAGGGWLRE